MTTPSDVLSFWFGELDEDGAPRPEVAQRWFEKNPAFDEEARRAFGDDVEAALRGDRDDWASSPQGTLALILLLDQLPRNLFRGTPTSFAGDARALAVSQAAVARGDDRALTTLERAFLYMPHMHSEDVEVQRRSVELFEGLARQAPPRLKPQAESSLDFARRHRDIVERFGRYPHRNEILGRPSTPEEIAFLKEPGSSF